VSDLLTLAHVDVGFATDEGTVSAVSDVSLTVEEGEIFGLVGESGCGKTTLAMALMGLLPATASVAGSVRFGERELFGLADEELRQLRGDRISMIFQDPMTSLDPTFPIGAQVAETITAHRDVSKHAARERALGLLADVGIPEAERRYDDPPHRLSGGMRQRVVIATALANEPSLVLADEPTTALDVTIQGQILHEMQRLSRESGTALIWITHDLSVIAGLADEVCVMYAGRIVESGGVDEVLDTPMHPYTRGLLDSVPSRNTPGRPLSQIRGMTPSLLALGEACAFRERCARAIDACRAAPVTQSIGTRGVRCVNPLA